MSGSVRGAGSVYSAGAGGGREGSVASSHGQLGALQTRLLAAKEARKLVEQDAQLLANRIALLKQEEEKAWRKIEQTRSRARDILKTRKENEDKVVARVIAKKSQAGELSTIMDKHLAEKQAAVAARERQVLAQERERREAARRLKEQKIEHRRMLERQKVEDQKRAIAKREEIKAAKEIARAKKEKADRARAKRNKKLYDQKVQREEEERKAVESEVAELERMEAELIEKLKKTQASQHKAYNKLEDALTGEGL